MRFPGPVVGWLFLCVGFAPVSSPAFQAAAESVELREVAADVFLAGRERVAKRRFDPAYRRHVTRRLASSFSLPQLETLASHPSEAPTILGGGLGSSLSDLVFTPVVPCRIVDTRLGGGVMVGGTARPFFVAGTSGFPTQGGTTGGCHVPVGATAAVLNIVAVTPGGPGNLRAYAYDEPLPAPPTAAVLNFGSVNGLPAIANGAIVPLCDPLSMTCTFDMIIFAAVSSLDVVVDVAGYFTAFPTAAIMTTVLANDGPGSGLDADLLDGLSSASFQARVTAPCPAGQSIRAIDALGAVTCEVDDNTTYSAGSGLVLTGTTFSVDPTVFHAGPGYAFNSAFADIASTTAVDVIAVTITAPVAGNVLVIASGDLLCLTCVNDTEATIYNLWITNAAGGGAVDNATGRLPGAVTNAPIPRATIQRVIGVAAGTHTFWFRGALLSGVETLRVLRMSITASFFPI